MTDSLLLNPALASTFAPPVMQARRRLDGVTLSPDRPLITVRQTAPVALRIGALADRLCDFAG